jgi:hypothetical protein
VSDETSNIDPRLLAARAALAASAPKPKSSQRKLAESEAAIHVLVLADAWPNDASAKPTSQQLVAGVAAYQSGDGKVRGNEYKRWGATVARAVIAREDKLRRKLPRQKTTTQKPNDNPDGARHEPVETLNRPHNSVHANADERLQNLVDKGVKGLVLKGPPNSRSFFSAVMNKHSVAELRLLARAISADNDALEYIGQIQPEDREIFEAALAVM